MKTLPPIFIGIFLLLHAAIGQTNPDTIVDKAFIERILNGLASDEMRGRHALSPDGLRAAEFIANEFKEIDLNTFVDSDYKQHFELRKLKRKTSIIEWGDKILESNKYLILGNNEKIEWNNKSAISIATIHKDEDFSLKFRSIVQAKKDAIVLVDPSFESYIDRFNKIYGPNNIIPTDFGTTPTVVFILAKKMPSNYSIKYENSIKKFPLCNVVGVLPGKSKPHEIVVFSGHYDHIGILEADGQDSIANGADDDASGITALISLAKYFKSTNDNERTIIFAAFTAEEIGMFGSKYFSNNVNEDSIIAMINIEMIGKDSKFGPNTMFLTGYDRSNLGELMQTNLKGSSFKFYPDPYPKQNLFYRSDNAVLAALGVPAHTFSTSQIDKDSYYHTVKDEISTLDINNIKSSIEAIALGIRHIISGQQTPSRVEKLKD